MTVSFLLVEPGKQRLDVHPLVTYVPKDECQATGQSRGKGIPTGVQGWTVRYRREERSTAAARDASPGLGAQLVTIDTHQNLYNALGSPVPQF